MCRVVLSKPRLVLMDESTSALDVDNESRLYSLLRERGVTFVSVGHRPTLADFHDQVYLHAVWVQQNHLQHVSASPLVPSHSRDSSVTSVSLAGCSLNSHESVCCVMAKRATVWRHSCGAQSMHAGAEDTLQHTKVGSEWWCCRCCA